MIQNNDRISENEVSMVTLSELEKKTSEEVELIPDVEMIEELSEASKKKQDKAISLMRERAMAIVDAKKLPSALEEIDSIALCTKLLNESLKENTIKIKTAKDFKLMAEAQKLMLQNVQTLLRTDSGNAAGDSRESYVVLKFGDSAGTTEVAIKNKR